LRPEGKTACNDERNNSCLDSKRFPAPQYILSNDKRRGRPKQVFRVRKKLAPTTRTSSRAAREQKRKRKISVMNGKISSGEERAGTVLTRRNDCVVVGGITEQKKGLLPKVERETTEEGQLRSVSSYEGGGPNLVRNSVLRV